ncbi:hypothetical protein LCGC14_2864740 [marine sediment metagenome]|uniref:Uncharacterized protein n=1 Tax=marine sediment metagenome TaxID=412755 RepID=A0A0F9AVS3_9ZZZZ
MKIYKYLMIMIVSVLVFEIMGVTTGAETILDLIGVDLQAGEITVSDSTFYRRIFLSGGVLTLLTAATVVAGLLVGLRESAVVLPFIIGTLFVFAGTFVGIMQLTIASNQAWLSAIIVSILAPFSIGFAIALIEFFRGTD